MKAKGQIIEKGEVWKKLKAKIGKMGEESRVKVGVLAVNASKVHQSKHPGPEITMIELAAIHEFGSPAAGIPERSFIRSTFKEHRGEMKEVCEKIARGILNDKFSVEKGLALLGQWGQSAVKKQITEGEGIPPPLKPETIRRKGSTRPLVDTGQLLGSITYQVIGSEGGEVGGDDEGGGEGGEEGSE